MPSYAQCFQEFGESSDSLYLEINNFPSGHLANGFYSFQQYFESSKSDWEVKEMGVERSIVIILKSFKKISSFENEVFVGSFPFTSVKCSGKKGRKEGGKESQLSIEVNLHRLLLQFSCSVVSDSL